MDCPAPGGILIAHRCLNAVQSRFLALGGRIVTGRVESVESQKGAGVRIDIRSNTSDHIETLSFDSTVVCAGPWTAKLIPQLSRFLSSLLTPVTYWHDPDTGDLVSFNPYIKKVKHYVREHLPLLDHRKPAIVETCMYTMTPDSNPIIDRLAGNLIVGCGFSGSDFKHSPATGWMLAALALGREDALPEGFQADRCVFDRFRDIAL